MSRRFAVPCYQGVLTDHFGHCEQFAIVDVDESNVITKSEMITPPVHQPGLYPKWLREEFAIKTVLAGGIGQMARNLFEAEGIEVLAGVASGKPEALVASYLAGEVKDGSNRCDH
ncbi:ATPase [bacterium]|nr:ATPase [bacterium]